MCTNCQAIVDTGSMLIIGPTSVVNSFHNSIGAFLDPSGTGYYLVSCSLINTFPSKIFFILLKIRKPYPTI